jgi:hypothetical protein
MKNVMLFCIPLLFLSCWFDKNQTVDKYYKCFFIGENLFTINGEVFDNHNVNYEDFFKNPYNFNNVCVKTEFINSWQILGKKNVRK